MFSAIVRSVSAALLLVPLGAAGPATAANAPVHWVQEAGLNGQILQEDGENPIGIGGWVDHTYLAGQGFDTDLVVDRTEPHFHDGSLRLTTRGQVGGIEYRFSHEPTFDHITGSYFLRARSGSPARYALLVHCSGETGRDAPLLGLTFADALPTGRRWHHIDVSAPEGRWRAGRNSPLPDGPHRLSTFMNACPAGTVYGYGITMPGKDSISYVDGVRYGGTGTDFLVPPVARLGLYGDTAAEVTRAEFYSPGYVNRFDGPVQPAQALVVANRHHWGDGILAGALANAVHGQLLLADSTVPTPPGDTDFVSAQAPVYLVGDRGALSDQIANLYRDRGHPVHRITAADAHDLDVAVAREIARHDGHHRRTVLLATRHRYHDALAASAVAGKLHGAVLFTEGHRLSKPVARYLAHHPRTRVIAVGPAASDASRHLPDVVRVARHTIAGTTVALARRFYPSVHTAVFTTESSVTQALSAGTLAGAEHAPLLFVVDDLVPGATRHYVRDHRDALDGSLLVGDNEAVSPETFDRLSRLLEPR